MQNKKHDVSMPSSYLNMKVSGSLLMLNVIFETQCGLVPRLTCKKVKVSLVA